MTAPYSSQHSVLTFAGQDALDPCVIKIWVADISTVLEPSTAASAATEFAGCLHIAALGACGADRLGACFCNCLAFTRERHIETDVTTHYKRAQHTLQASEFAPSSRSDISSISTVEII